MHKAPEKHRLKEKLTEKLFLGICSPEELDILFTLIREDPSPPSKALMEKLWWQSRHNVNADKAHQRNVWKKLSDEIGSSSPQAPKKLLVNEIVPPLKKWLIGLAACLLIVIGSLLFVWSEPQGDVVRTGNGERRSIEFHDGSKMRLNANSYITYSSDWSTTETRKVRLDGEAYFEVQKKPKTGQKFQVLTEYLIIEVLGTSFNVNTYGNETSVYLSEGSIRLKVKDSDSPIMMEPRDYLIFSKKDQRIYHRKSEVADVHTSWKDGVLTFRNSPLREVLQKIEQIYGITFRITNEKHYLREVEFPLPIDSLEIALSILDKTLTDIRIVKEGDEYILL